MEAWRCRCGSVAGTLDLSGAAHLVCYRKDCRRFAELLGAGMHVLDRAGGTALVQVRVDALSLAAGRGSLRAMHLTDRPSLRWYAGCCDTPLFNTYAHGRVPYLSVVSANLDRETRRRLGPPGFALSTESATSVPLAKPRGGDPCRVRHRRAHDP